MRWHNYLVVPENWWNLLDNLYFPLLLDGNITYAKIYFHIIRSELETTDIYSKLFRKPESIKSMMYERQLFVALEQLKNTV